MIRKPIRGDLILQALAVYKLVKGDTLRGSERGQEVDFFVDGGGEFCSPPRLQ